MAGVTTFADLSDYPFEVAEICNKIGMRAFAAVTVSEKENFEKTLKKIKKLKYEFSNLVIPFLKVNTDSEKNLDLAIKLSKTEDLIIYIEINRTLNEIGEFFSREKLTPAAYLEKAGILDRYCVLAGCAHLDKEDLNIISAYENSIVISPSNDLRLGSGIAPLYSVKNAGINAAIGTNSPDSFNFFREMFLSVNLQKTVLSDAKIMSNTEAVKMAVLNGAKAFKLNSAGEIKEGSFADLILINTKGMHFQPRNNLLSNLVHNAENSDIILTMVNGKILQENRKILFDL